MLRRGRDLVIMRRNETAWISVGSAQVLPDKRKSIKPVPTLPDFVARSFHTSSLCAGPTAPLLSHVG